MHSICFAWCIPKLIRLAKVIPLFNGIEGCYWLPTYLHPPMFFKIPERLMYDRIMAFVKENNNKYNMKFSFRSGHSTSIVLVILTDRISKTLYNSESVLCVSFSLILAKLLIWLIIKFCGENYIFMVSEALLVIGWTPTYRVGLDTTSHKKTITCGVPQGSTLGLYYFFIIYQWHGLRLWCIVPDTVRWWYWFCF